MCIRDSPQAARLTVGHGLLLRGGGPYGLHLRGGLACRRLAPLDVAERAAQLALQRLVLLAQRVQVAAGALGVGAGLRARLRQLLAQRGQLAFGLLAGLFRAGALRLLAGRRDQLDPALGAQHIGRRRDIERVGGGGRGAVVQRFGQFRLGLTQPARDPLPEDRVVLQRGRHRVARELGPAAGGEPGVLAQRRRKFGDRQAAEGLRGERHDPAPHALGQGTVEHLVRLGRTGLGSVLRPRGPFWTLHHCCIAPISGARLRHWRPAGRPARSGRPRCTSGSARTRCSH